MEYEPTLNFSESILKKPAGFFFSFFFLFFFLPFLVYLFDSCPESDEDLIFSLQCRPWITLVGHMSKGNNHQVKNLLNVKQILLVSTLGKCMQNIMENLHTNLVV